MHTDAGCFGERVVVLSLLASCSMLFQRAGQKVEQRLEGGSLLELGGEARH
jgi:alkylated DNA repair dioxygenase AlkB